MSLSKSDRGRAAEHAADQAENAEFESFVAEIVDLARSVDPALATLLTGEPASEPKKRWQGGHRRGLELCLRMLRYARDEVARGEEGQRLDACIDHVIWRLEQLDELTEKLAKQ